MDNLIWSKVLHLLEIIGILTILVLFFNWGAYMVWDIHPNTNKVYQYEIVKASDFTKGHGVFTKKLPKYVTFSTPTYESTSITLNYKNTGYIITFDEYVKATSINWHYKGTLNEESFSADNLSGTIQYEDGNSRGISIKIARYSEGRVVISDGVNSFTWIPEQEG